MSVDISVDVSGALKKLDLTNKKLTPLIGRALLKGGFLVEGEAKNICPVDTGRLRASIHTTQKSDFEVVVSDKTSYGLFVEFGTSKQKSQPFMRPALNVKKPEIIRLLNDAVNDAAK